MNAKPIETTPADVRKDWEWAATHEPELLKFLRDYIFREFMRESDRREDSQHATDYVFSAPGQRRVAVRVRRVSSTGTRRDFTIRATRPRGTKTELTKILEGDGDIYLYCWIDDRENKLAEYMIVDMDRFRKSPVSQKPDGSRENRDKSSTWVFWRWETMQDSGCLIEHIKYPGAAVSFKTIIK